MHFVYILYSTILEKYYIGCTSNLEERLYKHLHSSKGFTSRAKDWTIAYHEEYSTKSEALTREKQIKNWKNRSLIENLITTQRNTG
jgi:putative endonuclease